MSLRKKEAPPPTPAPTQTMETKFRFARALLPESKSNCSWKPGSEVIEEAEAWSHAIHDCQYQRIELLAFVDLPRGTADMAYSMHEKSNVRLKIISRGAFLTAPTWWARDEPWKNFLTAILDCNG